MKTEYFPVLLALQCFCFVGFLSCAAAQGDPSILCYHANGTSESVSCSQARAINPSRCYFWDSLVEWFGYDSCDGPLECDDSCGAGQRCLGGSCYVCGSCEPWSGACGTGMNHCDQECEVVCPDGEYCDGVACRAYDPPPPPTSCQAGSEVYMICSSPGGTEQSCVSCAELGRCGPVEEFSVSDHCAIAGGDCGPCPTAGTCNNKLHSDYPALNSRPAKEYTQYYYSAAPSAGGATWLQGVVPANPSIVPAPVPQERWLGRAARQRLDTSLHANDGTYVKTTLRPGETAPTLYVTRFTGEKMPRDTRIYGIEFILRRYASAPGLKDVSMKLIIEGEVRDDTEIADRVPADYWCTKEANYRLGSHTLLWGAELWPIRVSDTFFGVAITTKNTNETSTIDAYYNEIDLVIHYDWSLGGSGPLVLLDDSAGEVSEVLDDENPGAALSSATVVVACVGAAVAVAALVTAVVVVRRKLAKKRAAVAVPEADLQGVGVEPACDGSELPDNTNPLYTDSSSQETAVALP